MSRSRCAALVFVGITLVLVGLPMFLVGFDGPGKGYQNDVRWMTVLLGATLTSAGCTLGGYAITSREVQYMKEQRRAVDEKYGARE